MATTLTFNNKINTSLQVNDIAYYSNPVALGGYNTSSISDIVIIGPVLEIENYNNMGSFVTNKHKVEVVSATVDADVSFFAAPLRFNNESLNPYDIPKEQISVIINGVTLNPDDYAWDTVAPLLTRRRITFVTPLNAQDEIQLEILRYIKVDDSNFLNPITNQLTVNSFIMFSKSNNVNSASLKGYYADIKFTNESTEKAELFAVGSEINESSK
tara:strand:- start:4879 stop:5520 length:642 start_codon:yes stop_codon:yes gene_type:complete